MNFATMTESQRQQRNAQFLVDELDKGKFPEEWEQPITTPSNLIPIS